MGSYVGTCLRTNLLHLQPNHNTVRQQTQCQSHTNQKKSIFESHAAPTNQIRQHVGDGARDASLTMDLAAKKRVRMRSRQQKTAHKCWSVIVADKVQNVVTNHQ
jgi:hypothetical protein